MEQASTNTKPDAHRPPVNSKNAEKDLTKKDSPDHITPVLTVLQKTDIDAY